MYVFYKKLNIIFVLISTSLIGLSQEVIEIQLVSISNIYNNHIGNEWSHNVTACLLKEGCNITPSNYKYLSFKQFELNTSILKVNCIEFDEKCTNYGSNTKTINLSKINPK